VFASWENKPRGTMSCSTQFKAWKRRKYFSEWCPPLVGHQKRWAAIETNKLIERFFITSSEYLALHCRLSDFSSHVSLKTLHLGVANCPNRQGENGSPASTNPMISRVTIALSHPNQRGKASLRNPKKLVAAVAVPSPAQTERTVSWLRRFITT
jgi:hypothetical protein